ncbi:MAG: hypothetical protein IPN15_05965 [Saprospiraceae bacterium]|nr:hypothetical protein [Candidatus Vicinibacter affinis]
MFDVNAILVYKWQPEFLGNLGSVFEKEKSTTDNSDNVEIEKLNAQIDHMKNENNFLNKL